MPDPHESRRLLAGPARGARSAVTEVTVDEPKPGYLTPADLRASRTIAMPNRRSGGMLLSVTFVSATALLSSSLASAAGAFEGSPAAPYYDSYAWPVQGPVLREFEEPPGPYAPGHRGIDVAAALGTTIVASNDGVVAFAGWVGGPCSSRSTIPMAFGQRIRGCPPSRSTKATPSRRSSR